MSFIVAIVKAGEPRGGVVVMRRYKVTVCGVGYAYVEAESEQEAREKAGALFPEQIHWNSRNGKQHPLMVVYAEVEDTDCKDA